MKTPPRTENLSPKIRAALIALASLVLMPGFALANTELWIGTNDISATTNWSDNLNWNNVTGGGGPGPNGNDVVFSDVGAVLGPGIVNSVVDNSQLNPFSLTFTNNTTVGNYHTVLIPAGVNVTNANGLTVGVRLSPTTAFATTVAMQGGGTFVQNGSTVQIDDSMTSAASGSGQTATLDLSGLTNFIFINTNSGSTLTVGGTSSGSEARAGGALNLAAVSNYITVSNLNMALGSGNSGPGATLNLGTGTNIINVANVNLAAGKINTATIKFSGPTGGLRLRGFTGADSDRNVTMVLGNRSNSGTGTPTGNLNFLGGYPVDIKVNTITMGKSNQTGGGAANLSFDTGTFDATTINMGIASNTGTVQSTITVSGGQLIVNNLSMANQTSTGLATANLNINAPGTVICSNSIVKTTTAGVGNITMTGGTLIVATNIGSAANAIDALSVANSTLTLPAGLNATAYATNLTATGTANTINVTSVPSFFSYPAQFPIISYITAGGDNNTFVVGTLPGTLQGYISNNVGNLSIDVVITNGPSLAALKAISWKGAPTGDWTTNTSTLNWVTNGLSVNYNQGDTVTFDDTLTGTTNVNLTMKLTPSELTVNNSLSNYVFTGTGRLSGEAGLTKNGSGTLIIDNSGSNDFTGAVNINAGTVQVGNNDANGNLPVSDAWTNAGTLAFSRSDNVTISTVITGTGSLLQTGNGTLSLNATETYTGNTIISQGTLALVGNASIGSTAAIYPNGGTFDVSSATPSLALNPIGLASGGSLVVGTNNVSVSALSTTNSTITLAPSSAAPSMAVSSLVTGGSTNYINITRVFGVDPSTPPPVIIPIITYSSANFSSGFNFGETNFPNAYVTNDTTANSIDLVLTASPYSVTWNGGSPSDNNWSDKANWSGTAIFPLDNLTFDGFNRLTPVNDTAAGTTYSNITFNSTAGAFTLTGNPITLSGAIANNSVNTQIVSIALNFTGSAAALNGTAGPLIIGGGVTNVGPSGSTLTLMGSGILTNLLGSTGATNALIENDAAGNWTLVDNASSVTSTVPLAVEINNGTFNFGTASSAPTLISTSPQGVPSDNQVGGNGGTAVLNFSNGVFTTSGRLNTGAGSSSVSGTINQYGGTFNIASQFQGANGNAGATSAVNLYGGTMNIGVSPTGTNFGPFYVASRGTSSLTITNSAVLNCGTLDVSRAILSGISGTVNLNGGTIVANNVGTATSASGSGSTGDLATFNFNGGILKARASSSTFFQGRTTAPIVPITAIVQTGGAIIDSDTNSIGFLEPLLTDPSLAGAPDGGLIKRGTGTLTLAGTNTYIGNTVVSAGTLLVNGQNGNSLVTVSSSATLGGNGTIASNVIVNAGGTLAPGNNGIGTLTVGGNVTLGGTTTMEINKGLGTSDQLLATNVGPTTITYGGTLNVVVANGTLALNDSFQLFSATNYVGAFSAITPATPGAGLAWNTNNLAVNGTLSVVAGAAGPTTNVTIMSVTLSGTNLLIHGTNNNVPNNTGRFVVLTATNLLTPLTNWVPVSTNSYNNTGTLDYTNPIVPGTPNEFIDIQAVQ